MRALLALFTERPRLLVGSRGSTMFMFLIVKAFPGPCCTGLYISSIVLSTSPLSSAPPSAPATGSTAHSQDKLFLRYGSICMQQYSFSAKPTSQGTLQCDINF